MMRTALRARAWVRGCVGAWVRGCVGAWVRAGMQGRCGRAGAPGSGPRGAAGPREGQRRAGAPDDGHQVEAKHLAGGGGVGEAETVSA